MLAAAHTLQVKTMGQKAMIFKPMHVADTMRTRSV